MHGDRIMTVNVVRLVSVAAAAAAAVVVENIQL
jgi:hypothetical protein